MVWRFLESFSLFVRMKIGSRTWCLWCGVGLLAGLAFVRHFSPWLFLYRHPRYCAAAAVLYGVHLLYSDTATWFVLPLVALSTKVQCKVLRVCCLHPSLCFYPRNKLTFLSFLSLSLAACCAVDAPSLESLGAFLRHEHNRRSSLFFQLLRFVGC